jgi:dihydrofolate synthase/folylpolyglutamate synthase
MDGAAVREARAGVEIETPERRYAGLRPLPGTHQVQNLVVALRLLEAARRAGVPVDLAALGRGINRTRWPGRLQWIPGRPRLLLDGAHNPAGARALAEYLRALRPFVLVFGVMRDKDVAGMAAALFPLAREVVLTRPDVRRAATPAEIARRAGRAGRRAHREGDPRRALRLARRLAGPGGTVVVAGSLYLVGAVLQALRGARR